MKYPVVTITGPRQSGKTTLCRKVFPQYEYVSFENPDTRHFAATDPRGFLARYKEGAIFDEIQRVPDLSSYIQGIVDESKKNGLFIITGSQQFEVMSSITQSLAGRTALLKLLPFSLTEISAYNIHFSNDQLMLTGFYPRIYDAGLDPTQALGDYFETYVERDLRQILSVKDLSSFERFVRLCAGRCGQLLNLHSLANDAGVSHTTAKNWLAILEASYIVFLLRPWHRNISKRLVKSSKLYFYDVGLASYLLGIENETHIIRHPLRGNLFENLVVIEALKNRFNRGKRCNFTFYRDSNGNEVDLIFEVGPDIFPVEIKAGATITEDFLRSLKRFAKVITDLPFGSGLVYGGDKEQIRSGLHIVPISGIEKMLESVGI
jgi:predicted AAA+ superfamily ATPase